MSSKNNTLTSADVISFLPQPHEYRIHSCKFTENSGLFDASLLPACTVSFTFKGSTHEELYAWFEEFKVCKLPCIVFGDIDLRLILVKVYYSTISCHAYIMCHSFFSVRFFSFFANYRLSSTNWLVNFGSRRFLHHMSTSHKSDH